MPPFYKRILIRIINVVVINASNTFQMGGDGRLGRNDDAISEPGWMVVSIRDL